MNSENFQKKTVIIVSGLAGAGKTTVIHALEDLGYYCVDNLPSLFLQSMADHSVLSQIKSDHIALSLDSRDFDTPLMLNQVFPALDQVAHIRVLYLGASVEALIQRFRETRRQHPLSVKNPLLSLMDAIELDRQALAPIQKLASRVLDTSHLSLQALKHFVYHHFAPSQNSLHVLLSFVSFGFKYAVPNDLDTLFDVRCFPNPYYQSDLRFLTGCDQSVKNYVLSDSNVQRFMDRVFVLLQEMYPLYQAEGKKYFSIGIGCTGGKHRSVAIVEELALRFKAILPLVRTEHRHISIGQ